jgi:hypothetical protein
VKKEPNIKIHRSRKKMEIRKKQRKSFMLPEMKGCLISRWVCQNHSDSPWFYISYRISKIIVIHRNSDIPTIIPNTRRRQLNSYRVMGKGAEFWEYNNNRAWRGNITNIWTFNLIATPTCLCYDFYECVWIVEIMFGLYLDVH